MKRNAQLPQLRALAFLGAGDANAAAAETDLALRMTDAVASEPLLISQLVRIAQLNIALQPVWEGLVRRQWSDAQLAGFEARLGGMEFFEAFRLAIRGERNFGTFQMLRLMKHEPELLTALSGEVQSGDYYPLMLMPDAFADHSTVLIGRMLDQSLATVDVEGRRFDPAVPEAVEKDLIEARTHPWAHPYHWMARLLLPALSRVGLIMAHAQTTVDLARVAIALERHRLRHGAYPATLEALDAAVVPAGGIPHDVISGGPLHYAPTADGRFHLYAVGWNGTDEGGSVVWDDENETRQRYEEGDWVWPQPRE